MRYWLPVAPVVLATSIGALIAGWDNPRERAWLGVSAASTTSGGLVTAYVVRGINHKLLFAAQPLPPTDRQARWMTGQVLQVAGGHGL